MKKFLLLVGALCLCHALSSAAEDPTQEAPPMAEAGWSFWGLDTMYATALTGAVQSL
jgi:hypothetical protein